MDTRQDERLMNYVDGLLSPTEQEKLELELQTSLEMRERLEMFRLLTQQLNTYSLEEPSKNFTHKVLDNLDKKPATSPLSPRNGLLLLTGVLVAVIAVSFLLGKGFYNEPMTLPISQMNFISFKETLPLAISGKLVVNGILIIAMAISFLVLDRTVLKPMFSRRLNHY